MNPGQSPGAQVVPDEPQSAVAHLAPEASGVVVGAPGTGKTTALVERVRALVSEGVPVDDILVLTPSRQTATALRDRLALAVARATSGSMARSVASFAFQLVRSAAVTQGDEPPQLLTGGDEDQILQDLLDGDAADEEIGRGRGWPEWLPAPIRATHGFRAELRAFFAECTTLGISPDRLADLGRTLGLPAWVCAASFLREYADVLTRMRGAHRDAAGLVREAIGLVPDCPALPAIVLVDDAQELTSGSVELLEACAARGVAVLVFGDPDIGAGAFRGARPENFARLAARLGTAAVLREPHRGTAHQNDVVRSVTQCIGAAGVVEHRSAPAGVDADASLRALLVRSPAEEYDAIARILRSRHVEDGVPWAQCAVIAHDTRQVVALEAELSAREVPARASGPGLALGVLRPVRDLLHLVDLGMRPTEEWTHDDAEEALLGVCGGLDPISLRRLRSALRQSELTVAAESVVDPEAAPLAAPVERSGRDMLLSAMRTPIELDVIDTREARRAHRVARTIEDVRDARAQRATAHELLWIAWDSSRLERAWSEAARGTGPLAERANRDLDAVVSLFQAAKRSVERDVDADPRAFVRGILDSDVAEDRLDAVVPESAVRVLTPAGALGTEFDTVVIAGVQDGVWPNTRLRGSLLDTWRLADAAQGGEAAPGVLDRRRAAMHDELRLFVRALSRASEHVVVTAVDDDDTGPSVLFEFLPDPDRPTREMEHPLSLRGAVARHRRTLTEPTRSVAAERHAAGQLAVLARARVAGADPEQWYGAQPLTSTAPLREHEDVRVSPSRLDTLAECELNWVIGDLGGDPGGATAGLGTIVHAALEHAAGGDEAALWAAVDGRWGELVFEAPWRERAERARARDLVRRLALYLRTFERGGGELIGAEPHFEIPLSRGDASAEHGVILSGYIDRVERSGDGSVVIVDLKTGKREPQTDAAVRENAQLAAYQLAFETGAIPAAAGLPAGGAKLLVLRPSAKSKDFAEPWQPPFDDERRALFLERVLRSARVMSGTSFLAPYEEHCRDEFGYGLCRIHTVGSVSAS